MIHHLSGRLIEKNPTHAVIECGGVGYLVHISLQTFESLPDQKQIKLLTHLIVREDAQILYGFHNELERDLFIQLISVSGVGPSTARTMLSSLTAVDIQQAIMSEDVKVIQSVKGIGAKTAQRVILDLKDKMAKQFDLKIIEQSSSFPAKQEALTALEVLGFNSKQAEKALDKLVKENPDLKVEELIKKALKAL